MSIVKRRLFLAISLLEGVTGWSALLSRKSCSSRSQGDIPFFFSNTFCFSAWCARRREWSFSTLSFVSLAGILLESARTSMRILAFRGATFSVSLLFRYFYSCPGFIVATDSEEVVDHPSLSARGDLFSICDFPSAVTCFSKCPVRILLVRSRS